MSRVLCNVDGAFACEMVRSGRVGQRASEVPRLRLSPGGAPRLARGLLVALRWTARSGLSAPHAVSRSLKDDHGASQLRRFISSSSPPLHSACPPPLLCIPTTYADSQHSTARHTPCAFERRSAQRRRTLSPLPHRLASPRRPATPSPDPPRASAPPPPPPPPPHDGRRRERHLLGPARRQAARHDRRRVVRDRVARLHLGAPHVRRRAPVAAPAREEGARARRERVEGDPVLGVVARRRFRELARWRCVRSSFLPPLFSALDCAIRRPGADDELCADLLQALGFSLTYHVRPAPPRVERATSSCASS